MSCWAGGDVVSTELYVDTPVGLMTGDVSDAEPVDRVVKTAADRPSKSSLPPVPDPTCDHCDAERKRRRDDVETKHDRIREFLDRTDREAVVLGKADSVAWFTAGGELAQDYWSDNSSILLYINRKCRAVIADNVQSCRVFEEELAGLGFQLKERPWFDDPDRMVAELCHNKRYATDLASEGCTQWRRALDPLRDLRRRLTTLERDRLKELGRTLTLAVEATCRHIVQGEHEADVAGHLAHRLIREGVAPVDLRVVSDDRLSRYRQATFKSTPIQKRATIAVTGRRHGLCAGLTRTISFGPIDEEFRANHTLAAMVDATCIYFSRPGETVSEVFRRARRIYEKFDAPHEWTLDYQGVLIGYSPREAMLTPDSTLRLEPDMALCWNPSVGSARSEDTIVVDAQGCDVVTASHDWPQVDVCVKGHLVPRPGILER